MKALLSFIYCVALILTAPLSLAMANPIQSHYFKTSDGVELHYLEAGQGENTIVFIPGWLMPASIFERQLLVLSNHYRVLALDPRSQGKSQLTGLSHAPARRTQDIEELLTAAKVNQFILAGWSLGVLEVLDYLSKNKPTGLKGLILIDNSVGEGKPPPARNTNFTKTMQDPASREKYLRDFSQSMFREPAPQTMMQAILDSVLRVPPNIALQLINQPYPRTHWSRALAGQQVPVLYAIRPRFQDQANDLLLKRNKKLIQVEIFDSAGHALFVDDAKRFNSVALAFSNMAFNQ